MLWPAQSIKPCRRGLAEAGPLCARDHVGFAPGPYGQRALKASQDQIASIDEQLKARLEQRDRLGAPKQRLRPPKLPSTPTPKPAPKLSPPSRSVAEELKSVATDTTFVVVGSGSDLTGHIGVLDAS